MPVIEARGVHRRLREALLEEERSADRSSYVHNDPVQFGHRYADARDAEIAAMVSALLAFGRARAFLPKISELLEPMGPSPREYIRNFAPGRGGPALTEFRSRVYTGADVERLFLNVQRVLQEYSTLEQAFLHAGETPCGARGPETTRARLQAFASLFHRIPLRSKSGRTVPTPGYRHLVVDPSRGSACKRWNLFLRWMVRSRDGVDLGLWSGVSAADLIIPLDVHVGRITWLVNLRTRRTLDWKAAEEVTAKLRSVDETDPLRFDFALSHLGISRGCRGRYLAPACTACGLRKLCRVRKSS